jgi:hypothetical protein
MAIRSSLPHRAFNALYLQGSCSFFDTDAPNNERLRLRQSILGFLAFLGIEHISLHAEQLWQSPLKKISKILGHSETMKGGGKDCTFYRSINAKLEAYAHYYGFLREHDVLATPLNQRTHQSESRVFLHPEGVPPVTKIAQIP